MRCLTNSEIHKWLAGQGMHHQPLACGVPVAGEYSLPAERRSRLALVDCLTGLLSKDGNKLVEILPGPQPGSEEWEQISCFRSGLGESRPLIAAPGHLFKGGSHQEFRNLLTQLLGARDGWGFYIYSAPSHTTLHIEGQVGVWCQKKGARNELARQLLPSQAA